jgi:sugar phosphate isomerase/epimerase
MIFSLVSDVVTRDIDRMLHYALLWGFEAVELRMVGDARVPHVNEEKLIRRLQETEMEVSAVNPGLFEGSVREKVGWMNDLAMLPETIRFCERIDCSTILVSSFPDSEGVSAPSPDSDAARRMAAEALRRAGDVVGRKGLRIAVVNDAEGPAASTSALADLLADVDHEAVVAAWSPADALKAGSSPLDGLDGLAPRLACVRASQVRGPDYVPAPFDAGELDWTAILRRLQVQGFNGDITMELRAEPIKKQAVRDATWMISEWRKTRSGTGTTG